ncbi:hypothetical protein FRB93_003373 [Tulasnella sp. JGI-2019a]|nr:hypothetical protein FRB93_003373 [Tulasnella sp. JGI-2019a]
MGFCCGESKDVAPATQGRSNGTTYTPGYPTQSQPSPHPPLQAYPQTPGPENGTPKPEMTLRGERGISVPNGNGFSAHDNGPTTPPAAGDFNPAYPPGPAHTSTPGPGAYTPLLDPNIVRPNPVHAGRPGTTSPPLALDTPEQFSGPGSISSGVPPSMRRNMAGQSNIDDGKLSISVDFGTTTSGVAYGSSRINAGRVQNIIHWPGSFETFRKVPTCLLYDNNGRVLAWGLEAKNAGPMPGTVRCEWFKLFLEPRVLRDPTKIDPRLPPLPPNKSANDLIVDYLSCLFEYAKEQITREIGAVADLNEADVWLTVPAAWDAVGCELMREAAIKAGLVQAAHARDRNWRDRLRIITEPEAAAVHCAHLTDLHQLQPSQNFMICDAGGGTVDLAIYKIIGSLSNLEIAEVCARSGANCGSIFLDMRFRELVRTLLAEHPAHLDPASQAYFMHAFAETDKLAYMGESDDGKFHSCRYDIFLYSFTGHLENYFHFTCFNVEDPDDPSVGLVNGELAIPGILLRREVFDHVIESVLNLLEEQMAKVHDAPIDALLLVGGFSGSEYLFKRVEAQFRDRIKVIARPSDADTATSRGAAQYGLARRPLVSSVIAGRAYLMKVKLPAEHDDWMKRPAYIRENDAGVSICENRVQYLVQKGAILRKGQRIKTKFCKFSATPQDRIFVAVLYTSDSDKVMRYTDEGPVSELCKWSVDLGLLPSFQHHAVHGGNRQGFYTEFELGLELDSAEVRGVLLHQGDEVSRVVFDFFQ